MTRFESQHDNCISQCMVGQALAGLDVGLVLTNPSSKIIWLNRAAEKLLGIKKGSAFGEPIDKILRDPRLVSFWYEAVDQASHKSVEINIEWPRKLILKISATTCSAPDGALLGRALFFYDVSEERAVQISLSDAVARRLLDWAGEPSAMCKPVDGLTHQESLILRAVGKGSSNQAIADEFEISLSTVRSHLKNIYRKLGLSSRAEAVSFAARNNLL